MAQISYRYEGLFPSKYDIPDNAASIKDVKQVETDDFMKYFMSTFDEEALVPVKISIYGTSYEPGNVLVLEKGDVGEMTVGVLKAIAFFKGEVFFGCTMFEARQSVNGYYVTIKKVRNFYKQSYNKLADHNPLLRVGSSDSFCFSLHHFVSKSVED